MLKRHIAILATTLAAAIGTPALAADPLGSAADGVINPNGKEVPQTAQGVGNALGYDAWAAQSSNARMERQAARAALPSRTGAARIDHGPAQRGPGFGYQAGA